jgi:starch synthase
MEGKLRILSCAAECFPFAKTGGLADVVGALARSLAGRGHDVRVVMPLYRRLIKNVDWAACEWYRLGALSRWSWTGAPIHCAVHRPGGSGNLSFYFIEHPGFFERGGIYGDEHGGFGDNHWRFGLLALAAAALPEEMSWAPDIYHIHDWHAGLVAPLLRRHRQARGKRYLAQARIIHTIHNLAHRGMAPAEAAARVGLPDEVLGPDAGGIGGAFSYLKAGLAYSDAITTVSPTYARETLTPAEGSGLDSFLRYRVGRYAGILNGIDDEEWNPATDPHLPARYSAVDLWGKAECKRALQQEFGLEQRPRTPLLGVVSRLDPQKGHKLLLEILPALMQEDVQLALLGSGDPNLANALRNASRRWPGRVSAWIGYDNALSHRVEAGADLFLMPSLFEPCGLNQLYSMRYGTVPVVHLVGGLRDTVNPWSYERDAKRSRVEATGFGFEHFTPEAFLGTLKLALTIYRDYPEMFRQIQFNGMSQRLGWRDRIVEYERLFRRVREISPAVHPA